MTQCRFVFKPPSLFSVLNSHIRREKKKTTNGRGARKHLNRRSQKQQQEEERSKKRKKKEGYERKEKKSLPNALRREREAVTEGDVWRHKRTTTIDTSDHRTGRTCRRKTKKNHHHQNNHNHNHSNDNDNDNDDTNYSYTRNHKGTRHIYNSYTNGNTSSTNTIIIHHIYDCYRRRRKRRNHTRHHGCVNCDCCRYAVSHTPMITSSRPLLLQLMLLLRFLYSQRRTCLLLSPQMWMTHESEDCE
ncbi:hypothetical protein LSM04_003324 [Trypanosoma melophagium]|uniref:uncharacterized protein n=1 Tax=Trypanosoma melophagium TaxID=715481 RepID=UPI003519DE79|nr:hypothetical protein LSM04_003324 [Trypanosoma melophagium]